MRDLRTVLVLGGAGFLGQALCRILVEDGAIVVSLDRDPRGRLAQLSVESVQGEPDASDAALRELLEERDFDAVLCAIGTGTVPRSLENPVADLATNAASIL